MDDVTRDRMIGVVRLGSESAGQELDVGRVPFGLLFRAMGRSNICARAGGTRL